ncbi:hypothetical protein N7493_012051 [Penicillium malachiteum]|uniref:Uncharacterized protein n=1 Tax=Penicillium malachiteum TaxID=1324776 RepID=A0AAD6MPY1_9EURO|nr:hypothetical protein N7493_012051 [Penicillium malachiteum]
MNLELELDGLYILISDMGKVQRASHGKKYHMINNARTGHKWEYDAAATNNVPSSSIVLVGLTIGAIPSTKESVERLDNCLSRVFREPICLTWLKRAIYNLETARLISFQNGCTEHALEAEATGLAMSVKVTLGLKSMVKDSRYL